MTLSLSRQQPLFSGGEKNVYLHPHKPGVLVKVYKPDFYDRIARRHPFMAKWLRLHRYWSLLNQVEEFLFVQETGRQSYIEEVVGLAVTDVGVGLEVAAVCQIDGQPGQSLATVVKQQAFTTQHYASLQQLFDWLLTTHVIIRDLTLNNLVWDGVAQHFVIIDGIGGKPGFTLRHFSHRYNRRSNQLKINKFLYRLGKSLKKYPANFNPAL